MIQKKNYREVHLLIMLKSIHYSYPFLLDISCSRYKRTNTKKNTCQSGWNWFIMRKCLKLFVMVAMVVLITFF